MADKKIHLRVVTPARVKVDEKVDMVIMRCITGDLGVLPGHAPCSAVLYYGAMRILADESERRMAVYGGFATVQNDVLTILTNGAEWPEEINLARAEAEREAAEDRLREQTDEREIRNDQIRLRRALVQIEVSSDAVASLDDD